MTIEFNPKIRLILFLNSLLLTMIKSLNLYNVLNKIILKKLFIYFSGEVFNLKIIGQPINLDPIIEKKFDWNESNKNLFFGKTNF